MKNTTVIPNTEHKRYFHVSLYYFVRLLLEGNNSVRIELTYKVGQYAEEIGERHSQFLKLLFTDFNEDKIDLLFHLYVKLFVGIGEIRLMNIGNG